MLVDKIYEFLDNYDKSKVMDYKKFESRRRVGNEVGWAFDNQFLGVGWESENLYVSSACDCARKIAYLYHKFPVEGKDIDARGKIIFFEGNVLESMVTELARYSGANVTGIQDQQQRMEFELDGIKVVGKCDGFIFDDTDRVWLPMEIKSMNARKFKEFEKKGWDALSDTYKGQFQCYLHNFGAKKGLYVAVCKDTGHMAEHVIEYDAKIVKEAVGMFKDVANSTKKKLPGRKYSPVKLKSLKYETYPWMCSYCPYYKACLVDEGLAERVVANGAYKLKVLESGKEKS